MATSHRKLFPLLSDQTNCYTGICSQACPDNCYPYSDYPTISPAQPPPMPSPSAPSPSTTADQQEFRNAPFPSSAITIISVTTVVLIVLLTGIVLAARFKFNRRQRISRQHDRSDVEARDEFLDGDQVDHPIWFIRTAGLQQSIINSITVCRYKRGEGLIEGTGCPVCLNEFEEYEALRLLPKCNHAFHISCIDTWLASHTNCPLCRASIVTTAASQSSSLVDATSRVSSSPMEHSEDADEDDEINVSRGENREEPGRNPGEATSKEQVSSSCGNLVNSNQNHGGQMESSCLVDESDQHLEARGTDQSDNRDESDGEELARVSCESPNPHVDNSISSIPCAKSHTGKIDFPGKSVQNQNQEPRRISQSEEASNPETERHDRTIGEEASYSNDFKSFPLMDSDESDGRRSDDNRAHSQSAISSNMLKLTGSSSSISRFNRSKSSVFPLQ